MFIGIRDLAVYLVDIPLGYTMEWAPIPEVHRDQYDIKEERLRVILAAGHPGRQCGGSSRSGSQLWHCGSGDCPNPNDLGCSMAFRNVWLADWMERQYGSWETAWARAYDLSLPSVKDANFAYNDAYGRLKFGLGCLLRNRQAECLGDIA